MNIENEILGTFEAYRRWGSHYYDSKTAEKIIRLCTERDVAVIGMDGFYIEETKFIPDTNAMFTATSRGSSDWKKFAHDCNKVALRLLRDDSNHSSTVWHISISSKEKRDAFLNAPCTCGSGKKFKECHGA